MEQTEVFRGILDNLNEAVYFVDPDRRITYWNGYAEKITGYESEEVVGCLCSDHVLIHCDESGSQLCDDTCPLSRTLIDGESREIHLYMRHKYGHLVPVTVRVAPVRDEEGEITGAVEIFSENVLRPCLRDSMGDIERETLMDSLTELPNRRYLEGQLAGALAEQERLDRPFGVLLLDIDDLQSVNDTRGHKVGDGILRMIARTLSHSCRPYDAVGRWQNDQFLLLLRDVDRHDLVTVAERYRNLVAHSELPGSSGTVSVTSSIGATTARHGDTISSLVDRTSRMLRSSKRAGGDRVSLGDV